MQGNVRIRRTNLTPLQTRRWQGSASSAEADAADGARRADPATGCQGMNPVPTAMLMLLLVATAAEAEVLPCRAARGHDGTYWAYRIIDNRPCWYQGRPG